MHTHKNYEMAIEDYFVSFIRSDWLFRVGERIRLLRKNVSAIMLSILAISTLTSVFNIQSVKAEGTTATYSPWPMRFYDPQHTVRSSYSGPQTNDTKWVLTSPRFASGPLVGGDGTLYLCGRASTPQIYAIREDGTLKWNLTIGSYHDPAPIPSIIGSDGTIYAQGSISPWFTGVEYISYGHILYAINPNGTKKWIFDHSKFIHLTFFDNATHTHREDLRTGDVNIDHSGSIFFSVAKWSGTYLKEPWTLIEGKYTYYLFSVNPDGTLRWMYTFPPETTDISPIAIGHDGNIYMTPMDKISNRNNITVFSSNGYIILNKRIGWGTWLGSPAIGNDGTIYVNGVTLSALTSNGTMLWERQVIEGTGYSVTSTPIITNDSVIVLIHSMPNYRGAIRAFDFNGNTRWIFYFEMDTITSPSLMSGRPQQPIADGNGNVYFSAIMSEKRIYATYALKPDGTLKWTYNQSLWSFVIGFNNTLYAMGWDGLYAFGPGPALPGFSITASPTSLIIQQGSSDMSAITVRSIGAFNQPVQLTVSGAPSGVTTTLNPEQVTPPPDGSTTSTLTVSVGTTATPGTYTLTVTGTNGTITHSVDISLTITQVGEWSFDSGFQYNLDNNYETVEGTGHISGSATLSDGTLSIGGQVNINGPLPSAIPEVYLIATDGQDKELSKKIVDLTHFSYWQTGPNTYSFSGTIPDAPQPINNGHYEVSALITYGGTKYHFFINTASKISKHYFPLIPAALPTIPAQPVNLSPADGATDVSVTPVLVASPPLQDVPDELIPWEEIDGYIARVYSQWQVTTIPGDYSNPVYNETILGLISRWNRPEVWSTAIWDSLDYGTTYYWRVRYKDFRGVWSPWSEETSFTTIPWVLETDFSREIQFTVDETKRHIDSILEEARTSAKDGDYFATRFKAEQIDLIVDSIFDAFGTLSAAVPGGEDVIDLWKVSLSGGPDTPYAHILWFKHVYHDALFSSGEPSATTMDMLRWALTYYAADITGEAPERISVETLKLTLKNILRSSLALGQSFVPSLERLVENLEKDLDNTLSDVLAQIRDLTPEEVEAYRQDLLARRKANDVLLSNLWQLALPLHQSRVNWDQPGWKAKITQFFIRNLLRVLIGLVSDGPGVLIYSLGTLGWDAFQNMAELTEAAKMMDLAVAVVGNTFDTSRRIFLNTIRGLENIKHRVTPQIGQGEIVSINNMVIGEYKQFLGRWDLFIKEAFSDVTISNTGTANTIYELTATYGKWGILGTSYTSLISQKSLRINAGRTYTMRIYYYEEGRYGEIPSKGTEIEFTLLGTTETGTYYIGTAKTTFGTTVLADTKGLTISQHEMEESQIIPYPIRSFVENSLNSDVYTLKICIENPFNITVLGNITQQFPTSITILDANGGIFNENQVSWQITLDPGETRQYNVTFICQAAPGTIVEIQGATLNIYDPFADDIVSFETDLISLEAKFPVIVRAFPPVQASIREEIKVPMNITNLSDDAFNGNITLEFSDFEGNIIYNSTYKLYLMPKETKEIELLAAPNISAGIYVIKGILTKGEARTTVFAEYISIDASNVIGVALLAGRNNHKGSIIKLGDYITSTNPDGSYIFLGIPAGNYILTITHHGYASIMQEVTVNPYGFTVLQQYSLIDIGIPPKTLLEVSEPKFVAANMTYVTSATLITLVAEDNPGGSGVASTAYRMYNATYDSGWITYTQPFYLTGLSDGTYHIDYNSTDYAGNMELTNTVTIILDNTSPTTTLNIGEPKYVTDKTYVTSEVPFTLEAYDNAGSGIYSIAYRIYNDSYDSGWLPYTAPFYLTALADGAYTIEFNSTDNVGNVEPLNTAIVVLDNTEPSITVMNPPEGWALQNGVTFIISAIDAESGVSSVNFSIREANGGDGTPIGFEDIPATYNATTGKWTLFLDTLQIPDGYYTVIVKAKDNLGNIGSATVPYSIRNWAVLELLPATPNNKAGRTMPIKFALRVNASVDPNQPFVYNEELTIKIYAADDPSNILQTSTFGDTARDYRINTLEQLYITNFKTLKTPKTYVVEIWRNNMLIGSFEFTTVK